MNTNIKKIKSKLDIIDIATSYIQLKQVSNNQFKAITNPLRDERTSSLMFYTDTQKYYDYGTGESGDVLDFISRVTNKPLVDVIASFRDDSTINNDNSFIQALVPIKKKAQVFQPIPQAKTYDLNKIYYAMSQNKIPPNYVSKLFKVEVLKSFSNTQAVLKKSIVFNKLDNSLAIVLKDQKNNIKTIATHRSKDNIKWKTLGSKIFIPYKINDNSNIIFLLVGMKEYLLMEMMGVNYIIPQSDSIANNLKSNIIWLEEIKPKLKDKTIVYISENDNSSRNLIEPIKREHDNIINIDIRDLYLFHIIDADNSGADKELPKGYDVVDFVNEFKNIKNIQLTIKKFIEKGLKNEQ